MKIKHHLAMLKSNMASKLMIRNHNNEAIIANSSSWLLGLCAIIIRWRFYKGHTLIPPGSNFPEEIVSAGDEHRLARQKVCSAWLAWEFQISGKKLWAEGMSTGKPGRMSGGTKVGLQKWPPHVLPDYWLSIFLASLYPINSGQQAQKGDIYMTSALSGRGG